MTPPRVLALLSSPGDRRAIERWTAGHYELTSHWPDEGSGVEACLVDAASLRQYEARLHALHTRNDPLAVPLVLLASRHGDFPRGRPEHPDVDARVEYPVSARALLATLDQVTEQHRRSRQIEGKRRFLQGLLDQTLVGIYLVTADRIVYANAGACRIFGRPRTELEKASALSLFHEEDRPRIAAMRATSRTQDSPPEQVRVEKPDGSTRMVEVQELVIEHEGRLSRCGTVLDIQPRLDAEHARLAAVRREAGVRFELEISQLENRLHKRLFDALSHELRTPLMELRGYTEMCEEGPECTRDRLLTAIAASVDRLEHLVENLLQYTRFEIDLEAPHPEPLDPDDLVRQTCERIARHHPASALTLEPGEHAGTCLVQADGRLLELLLTNVIEDAFRQASPGATLDVSTRVDEAAWHFTLRFPRAGECGRPSATPGRTPVVDEFGMLGIASCVNERIARFHGARLDTHVEEGRVTVNLAMPLVRPAG